MERKSLFASEVNTLSEKRYQTSIIPVRPLVSLSSRMCCRTNLLWQFRNFVKLKGQSGRGNLECVYEWERGPESRVQTNSNLSRLPRKTKFETQLSLSLENGRRRVDDCRRRKAPIRRSLSSGIWCHLHRCSTPRCCWFESFFSLRRSIFAGYCEVFGA